MYRLIHAKDEQQQRTNMKKRKEQKILGVTIGNKLTFKSHIKSLFKKVSQKNWCSNHLNDA